MFSLTTSSSSSALCSSGGVPEVYPDLGVLGCKTDYLSLDLGAPLRQRLVVPFFSPAVLSFDGTLFSNIEDESFNLFESLVSTFFGSRLALNLHLMQSLHLYQREVYFFRIFSAASFLAASCYVIFLII